MLWAKKETNYRLFMIQTQLLKCDKPYQIISAAGKVGIQVATLIVTEDKVDVDGNYLIDTHSHPVVNYADKEGLAEELKYRDGNPVNEYKYTRRMQPEGAVWNKVEVRDVNVLGLAGTKNIPVDLEKFIDLVPSLGSDPTEHLWDKDIVNKIYSLHYELERTGLTFCLSNVDILDDESFNKAIYLQPDLDDDFKFVVKVKYRVGNEYSFGRFDEPLINSIFFKFSLSEDARNDARDLWNILKVLERIFKLNDAIIFVYDEPEVETELEWVEHVKRLTKELNKLR